MNQANSTLLNSDFLRRYRYLILTLVCFAVVTTVFYAVIYYQYRQWQAFIVPVTSLVGLTLAMQIFGFAKRGAVTVWSSIFLLLLSLIYGSAEGVWLEFTLFNLLSGLVMIILTGRVILPKKKMTWVTVGLVYVLYIAFLSRIEWYPRLSLETIPSAAVSVIAINATLIIALLAQVANELQIRSIRSRLLITFVLLVFIPVLVVGLVSNYLNSKNAQEQNIAQLESIMLLKQEQIKSWQEGLRVNLITLLPQQTELASILSLMDEYVRIGNVSFSPLYNDLLQKYTNAVNETGQFTGIFLLSPRLQTILSTQESTLDQLDLSQFGIQPSFETYTVTPIFIHPSNQQPTQVIAAPIVTQEGELVGILSARVNMDALIYILSQNMGLGETGETYLVLPNQRMVSPGQNSYQGQADLGVNSVGITLALQQKNGYGTYQGYKGDLVIGVYSWQPELQVALLAEQSRAEALQSANQVSIGIIILMIVGVIAAFIIGLVITNRIVQPLSDLALIAEKIAAGDLSLSANLSREDEIGELGLSFNSMTTQLRNLVTGLELRVAARTNDLERRSEQLRRAAEVARDATGYREINELLSRSVTLIEERFGYEFVSIYLIDERNENAVLSSAAGYRAVESLERGVRIRVGSPGPIGAVSNTGYPRLVTDGSSQVFDPMIPDTRSRMVLPLKVGQRVIGILDIHSNQLNKFDEDLMSILQVVADQLAIAIDGARLFQQMSGTVRELELLTGQYTHQSWRLARQNLPHPEGYTYRGTVVRRRGTKPLQPLQDGSPPKDLTRIQIPLKLRDQVIGALDLRFEGQEPDSDVLETLNEISERLTLLMENARLVMEARNLAAREQQINQITAQVRGSVNMEAILRNTVRELGRAFGSKRTFIQLGVIPEGDDGQNNTSSGGVE